MSVRGDDLPGARRSGTFGDLSITSRQTVVAQSVRLLKANLDVGCSGQPHPPPSVECASPSERIFLFHLDEILDSGFGYSIVLCLLSQSLAAAIYHTTSEDYSTASWS